MESLFGLRNCDKIFSVLIKYFRLLNIKIEITAHRKFWPELFNLLKSLKKTNPCFYNRKCCSPKSSALLQSFRSCNSMSILDLVGFKIL